MPADCLACRLRGAGRGRGWGAEKAARVIQALGGSARHLASPGIEQEIVVEGKCQLTAALLSLTPPHPAPPPSACLINISLASCTRSS